jgi:phenylacetate-CoA ligase
VARDLWEVRIVPDKDYDDAVGAKLIADFQRLISPRLNIAVKRVEHIDSLPSGKFKWVSQEWRVDDGVER